jgi:hypothetical protein
MGNKSNKRRSAALPSGGVSLCSAWELDSTSFAWDNRWGTPMEAAAVGAFAGDDVMRPPTSAVFQQSRRWWRLVRYIQKICELKLSFYNHGLLGLRQRPADEKKPMGDQVWECHPGIRAANESDAKKVSEWKRKNAAEIQRVVMDVWREWFITRNVVSLWRKKGRLIVKPPEQCVYADEFGIERLTIRHQLKKEQIDNMAGLTAAEKTKLKAGSELKLTHDDTVFSFQVLKDEGVGMGFGWPDLVTLFHVCSMEESLLVGDRQLADAARTVYEQHKLGHDIKSGPHAGSPAHFINKKRSEAVRKEIKSKKGHIQITTNFDHDIIIGAGRPDPRQYDYLRYKTVVEQMALWGAPFSQMWAGVVNPFLMTLARGLAAADRLRLAPYLAAILKEAMGAPAELALVWDDSCFWDSRLLLDVAKTGLAGGPLSQESFLRVAGFSPADERAQKLAESKMPKAVLEPAFDSAHGDKGAGKPAGTKDKS